MSKYLQEKNWDDRWLAKEVERISPDWDEMGNDAGYTRALIALVHEARDDKKELLEALKAAIAKATGG